MGNPDDVVDWEDLSQEDQSKAMELLQELNKIMDKYTDRSGSNGDKEILSSEK